MTAEEYIAQYGVALSEADKRYIRAFGPPSSGTFSGPSRRPTAPGLRIAAEETADPRRSITHTEHDRMQLGGNYASDDAHARTERGSYYARDTLAGGDE